MPNVNIITATMTLLGGKTPARDLAQEEYIKAWKVSMGGRIVLAYTLTSFPLYLVTAGAMWIFAPEFIRLALTLTFVGQAIISLLGITQRQRLLERPSWPFLAMIGSIGTLFPIFAFAVVFARGLAEPEIEIVYLIIFGFIYGIHACMICMSAPFLGKLTVFYNFAHAIAAICAWWAAGAAHFLPWSLCIVIADAFLAAYSQLLKVQAETQALTEYRSQQLLAENQKLQIAAMEAELRIASELQESLAPPPEALSGKGYTAQFYYLPFGVLGGDCIAARRLEDDTVAVVVGDVTGKGVAAAMVVHSVQSLWTEAINSEQFDAERWLQGVNQTLYLMGQQRAHTMTLGLLLLKSSSVVYYSAGHVPLAVLSKVEGRDTVHFVNGLGAPLGLERELKITPASLDLSKGQAHTLILGTDGVLSWKLRSSRKAMVQLKNAVHQRGKAALAEIGDDDDKILVVVDYAA